MPAAMHTSAGFVSLASIAPIGVPIATMARKDSSPMGKCIWIEPIHR